MFWMVGASLILQWFCRSTKSIVTFQPKVPIEWLSSCSRLEIQIKGSVDIMQHNIYIYIILLMAHASLCDSYAWRCPSRNTWLLLAPCPAHAQSIVFCSSPLTPFQSMKYWSLSFFLMCVLPRLHRRNSQVFVCWRQRTQGLKRYGLLEVFTIWIPFVVLISSTASKWTQLMDKVW